MEMSVYLSSIYLNSKLLLSLTKHPIISSSISSAWQACYQIVKRDAMTQKDKRYIINLNQHLSIYVVGTDNEYRPTLMIMVMIIVYTMYLYTTINCISQVKQVVFRIKYFFHFNTLI